MLALKGYLNHLNRDRNSVRLIIVCEDIEDFKQASALVCTVFTENMLPCVYYNSEGAVKSAGSSQFTVGISVFLRRDGNVAINETLESVSGQHIFVYFEYLYIVIFDSKLLMLNHKHSYYMNIRAMW